MEVAHDHTELLGRISAAGWTLNSLKQRGREFVAVATSPSGDKAERIGGTPKMALANLINYIDRANRMAPYKRAKTAAWATHWINDHERLADAYRKLPLYDEKAVPAWRALADESRAQADELRRQIEVIPVGRHNADQYGVDPERPYKGPEDLRNDIRNKRMFVSTENTDHPVWTPEDVANFRTVHNVLGVGQSNSPEYSWRGANMAFQSHAPYLSPDARKALFSEIIGQGAHHRHFRTFSEPRIALMDEHLMPAEDHESHHSINVTPTPVAHAGDQQEPGGWRSAALGEGPDVPSNLDPALLQKAIELFDAQVQRGEKPVSIFMGVADQLMSSGVPRPQAMEAARKALLNHEDRNLAIQSGPTMKDSPDTGIPNRLQQHGWQFNNWPKGWTEQLEQMPKRQGSEVPDHIPVGWTHKQPDLPKPGDLYSGHTSNDEMPLTEGMRVQHSIDGREGVVTGFHGDGDAAFVKFDDSGRDEIVRARRLKRLGSAEVQQMLDANRGQNLQGLPSKPVNVRGTGPLNFHSHGGIQQIANEYNQRVGLGEHPTNYSPVNPQIATRIAQEYEQMQHAPNDPQVKAAYDALKRESMDQYQALKDAGYTFDFYPEGQDPYPNSPREAVLDLHRNKHMKVFPTMGTDGGFGQDAADYPGHPLLDTVPGETWSRKPVTYNDVFRAIHDVYGHGKEGLGFRAEGEDNAFRQHSAMFSPLAQRALTSETRGQNSYVNYGPHGEHNQTATTDTVYAPQKAGLLPEWVSDPDLHLRGRQAKVARDLATDAVKAIATMGASLNPHTLEPFSALSGYMVSHQAPTEVVAADAFNKGRLLQFRHTAMPYVTASDYLGGWLEDGKVFLDLSEHILDRKEALQRAIDNKQIAIWGWAEQESIYVLDANGNVLPEIAAELNGWRASSFSDADKKRKVRSKAREVAKTDTGAKRVAKTAVEEHASKKLVREALKGEDSDWVEKVLKEMSRIKRTRGAIIMRRVLK